jgi:hypothetical protein
MGYYSSRVEQLQSCAREGEGNFIFSLSRDILFRCALSVWVRGWVREWGPSRGTRSGSCPGSGSGSGSGSGPGGLGFGVFSCILNSIHFQTHVHRVSRPLWIAGYSKGVIASAVVGSRSLAVYCPTQPHWAQARASSPTLCGPSV